MRTRLALFWDWLQSSFWFLPSAMALGAIALAYTTLGIDDLVSDRDPDEATWVYSGGAEGARALLSTVAGSMVTVAGVVFSMTMVALTLASTQLGPRVLRSFMRDQGNQFVLGAFIATYLYCLLVLRSIRGLEGFEMVPQVSVTTAVLLTLGSLGVLIYFIHHVAIMIQAPYMIAEVSRELAQSINHIFPTRLGEGVPPRRAEPDETVPDDFEFTTRPITALHSGYIQGIDARALMEIAVKEDLIVKLINRPGQFVLQGNVFARVWPANRVNEQIVGRIRETIVLGRQRTSTQDCEFPLGQLVEIALRALSPSLNDPFTAMTCIDWLGDALCHLASRHIPSPYRYDDDQRLRVIAEPVSFAMAVEASLTPIRRQSRDNPAVTARLLHIISAIALQVARPEDLEALRREACAIDERCGTDAAGEEDRAALEAQCQACLDILDKVAKVLNKSDLKKEELAGQT